ncbi:hypothetical protein SFBM_0370 [Candidatus Arthromitus sp. SFB-mouse-Japan]|uniref:DUF4956 domain-containing protein n=1 Tax=unclassified Candidatus Neoarthromitus TaxID=2638829 RepID=UPI00021B7E08|nr:MULTISPECIES: DUF4956 domain-containing protein [unclassified Candidatus Arthromitus]EIA24589.1 hypothetical protein SFB2_076G5 [Candidatus Arthromitus sp. SFB-2]EIA25730.1 hypothetical protein SFB3_075G2 [Candidatus Arthromitus sp. SFB-3]EIA29192.1 hypothetical protein SFB6_014G52 [Candidatus Arthromitus sp. SFB-co]EIA30417.1 hypothetical protein SFBSU_006G98 [Candidatus Arthromitus sp. SFB-mouse-SU]EIA31549.1 hypothetical protein SFB4_010G6 [Candidatus Arthromitus sp. SFB-4]
MFDWFFNSILIGNASSSVSGKNILICMAVSLVLGFCIAYIYMFKNVYSKGFIVTLTLMPAIVQLVIMLVNGNLGAGVAVTGAFSLVRFRSAPGSAKEIISIFLAMAVGLATGMGYIGVAVLFVIVMGILNIILNATKFGEGPPRQKTLKITIPESLDYTNIFDDIFTKYLKNWEIYQVRSINMGSLFKIEYKVVIKNSINEKQMIDDIRCRNGNLEIMIGKNLPSREEL